MKFLLSIYLSVSSLLLFGQDKDYARSVIKELTSRKYFGRGYTQNGLNKASQYLEKEFRKIGLQPMEGESFFQWYSFPVNTFPGIMNLEINGQKLRPGRDFIVAPESRGIKAEGTFRETDSVHFQDSSQTFRLLLSKKLTWSVSQEEEPFTTVVIDKRALNQKPEHYSVAIENLVIPAFSAANICGILKGKRRPDSLVLFTAHYDHLGGMGKDTYFPGANDNASGISMLLNLARHYAENPPEYSIGFICFSGEEAGLLGSRFFSEHPLIDLDNVRFLTNLDLVGTGDEGITVVNGSNLKEDFSLLKQINLENKYLPEVKARGKAANSDHYWFSKKGVPSFFIYTNGGIKAYHDIYDIAATLPLSEFEDLFRLLRDFNNKLMNP